ncbi:MAG: zinc-binding dehydrogenase, partial [Nocardioidaceae bacterium]
MTEHTQAAVATETASAAVWRGHAEGFTLVDEPLPDVTGGEVLVRVRMATICGSDLHTIDGDRDTPVPTILGHEAVGTVVAAGDAATTYAGEPLRAGTRVTWTIGTACGTCARCRRGVTQKCVSVRKYGHEAMSARWRLNGGFATHCHLLAGTGIVPLPASMPDEVATPANCATATVVCAVRRARLVPGDVAVVLGCGMLGLTAVAYAKDRGAARVVACDVDDRRRQAALAGEVEDLTGGAGAEVVLEMSGSPAAVQTSLDLVGVDGRIALVGSVSPAPEVSFEPSDVVRRLTTLVGCHN